MVRHRRAPQLEVDVRAHALARGDLATLHSGDDLLVVVTADDVLDDRAAVLGLDHAVVGDLAAAGRVERRLAQLQREQAVAAGLERADLRAHVQLLVADELGLEAGVQVGTAKPTAWVLARARSRCSSISRANSASSTALPWSAAISTVSSNGNP